MPYKVVKSGSGFKVKNKDSGKTYSKKPLTKEKAKKQMAALYIHTADESFNKKLDSILENIDAADKPNFMTLKGQRKKISGKRGTTSP